MEVRQKKDDGFEPIFIEIKIESKKELLAIDGITRLNISIPRLVGKELKSEVFDFLAKLSKSIKEFV